jgi:phosphate transport system substrate-binding protein
MSSNVIVWLLLSAPILAQTATNPQPANSLLLGEKRSFELTRELEQYEAQPGLSGRVTSIGGGSSALLVNRWVPEFAAIQPGIEVGFHGGSSATGMNGLIEANVDVVPMSRPVEAEETARFKAKYGYEPTEIVVAQDALGVYVNKTNPVAGFTLAQLDGIYSRDSKRGGGRPEFWSELGVTGPLAEERIDRISLNKAHGAHVYFQDIVMQDDAYRFDVRMEATGGSLVQAVGANNAAVGILSVMYATARTRLVPVQAADGSCVLPTYENISAGKYPLVRPLRIVFNRRPDGTMNAAAREFLRFVVSRRGQRVIALAGSYPLSTEQQKEALRTIGDAAPK